MRKGAPLFTLDARPFEAALQQAQAVLARDTAQAKNAQSQRTRYEDLFKRGLIPRDQYETQTANASALEATLAADQAQIENAQLNLQYTHILAPISGRTGALGVHQGDLVRANDTTPLVVINQVAPIYVTFSVPGRYLPDIRRHQAQQPLRIEARIQPGGTPGRAAGRAAAPGGTAPTVPTAAASAPAVPAAARGTNEAGTVSFIDNTVDPTTGTIKMKGTFAERRPRALAGPLRAGHAGPAHGSERHRRAGGRRAGIAGGAVRLRRQAGSNRRGPQRHGRTAAGRRDGDRAGPAPGEEVVTDGQLRLTAGRARHDRHAR